MRVFMFTCRVAEADGMPPRRLHGFPGDSKHIADLLGCFYVWDEPAALNLSVIALFRADRERDAFLAEPWPGVHPHAVE